MSEQETHHLLVEQTLQKALALHQAGQLSEAGELYRDILQNHPDHPEANHNMGVLAVQLKMPAAGLPYFTTALNADPARARYWLSYIDALFQSDQRGEALEVLAIARLQGLEGAEVEKLAAYLNGEGLADQLDVEQQKSTGDSSFESVPSDLNGLCPDPQELNGLVTLFGQGRFTEAAALAKTITEHFPLYGAGWKMLGVMLMQLGRNTDALAPMQRAAALLPGDAETFNLLGITLSDLGYPKEAEASYRRSLQINPNDPQVHTNLGASFQYQGLLEEAEASYRRALEIKPDYAKGYCNLGAVLDSLDRIEEAEISYRRALEHDPDHVEALSNLGNALKHLGRYEEAKASYLKAHQLGSAGAKIRAALMLPAIMGTRQEVVESRTKFERQLDKLIADKLTIDDPLERVGEANFYLAYHGLNDRDLQVKVARFYEQACPSLLFVAPHCLKSQSENRKKVRVGFFSKFLVSHSVSLCFSKVIETLSQNEKFEVCLFSNHTIDEKLYLAFVGKRVRLPENLVRARTILAESELDILVYLDIGMEPLSYFLAFSRLARAQFVLGGHPVTTGIRNMDYFLSAEAIEPLGADEHYSETLIRLPRPVVYYSRPKLPEKLKTRHELNLPTGRRIYMCPMKLQKLHPDFDEAIGRILQIDANGVVVLFEDGRRSWWKDAVSKRFESTIPAEVQHRIIFLPWLTDPIDFVSAIAVADVVIDPFHFGIGSTAIVTSLTGTPLITKIGEFMRGRVAAHYCQIFDVAECIAKDTEDYAQKAVSIASDKLLRENISAKILKNNSALYEDLRPVEDLADLFLSLTDS